MFCCMIIFYILFEIFWNFFQISRTPGGHWGGPWGLGGAPPEAPEAPPGIPGCHRVLEKIEKIPKNYIKNLHASKYPKL